MKTASKIRECDHRIKRPQINHIAFVFSVISFVWLILYVVPIKRRTKHPMFKKDRPLVMAHRGGAGLSPSNTLVAFQRAVDLGVDWIELDIHLTKDGHLVAIHDDTVDRTTNGAGKVNELTLVEVQSYDAGYNFVDTDGNHSYRGEGIVIPTLEDVFNTVPGDMRYTIEIKDTNEPALYEEIGRKLWAMMKKYDVQDKVLIGSFDQKIINIMTNISRGEAIISAGKQDVAKFVILHKLGLHTLYKSKVDSIEMPMKVAGINLMDKTLIDAANRRGMDIHYWTINDRDTMEKLIDLGADGIITDRPDILIDLLQEKGYK